MPGRPLTELFPRSNPAEARLRTYGYRSPEAVVGAGQVGQTDAEMMRLLGLWGTSNSSFASLTAASACLQPGAAGFRPGAFSATPTRRGNPPL